MIKKILFISLVIFSSHVSERSFAQAPLSVVAPQLPDVVPGVLYIQLKAKHGIDFERLSPTHTGNIALDNFFTKIGVTDIYPFDADANKYAVSCRHGIDRIYVINFSGEGISPHDVARDILNLEVIENASPRLIFEKCYTPNDPDVSQQYALDNMHIKQAWDISKGSANIVIADVDEGVNYKHEDLAGNIYLIDGLYPGRDIVGAGGANHFLPTNDPMPPTNQSHGTMTSGCFGAVADNGIGGAGSGFTCKIMAIKISDSTGTLVGGYEGIHYAVTHGANIINCSWGSSDGNPNDIAFVQLFINEAIDTGALVVVAAGNDGKNIDVSPFIPAYLKGVLTVGASDKADAPATESFTTNYGTHVGVYAPGVSIFSTSFPGNSAYTSESGTSFSCPLTAGVAGLLWAKHPDWTPKFIARQIIATSDNVVKPSDRKNYWGRVNAYSALIQSTVPGLKISDYSVDGVDKGGLQYLNKIYSLVGTFTNVMGSGSGIQASLLPVPGYTVQQGSASLGPMNAMQTSVGSFKFTRDSTDNGAGSQLTLYFAISYGASTVEGQKYYDTIPLIVNIVGDDVYINNGVHEKISNTIDLGNTYPNPVANDATIDFELVNPGYAKVILFDILGRTVAIIAEGLYEIGKQSVQLDARNLPNGMYFYKLETSGGAVLTKRMIVIHQ
ncbi:MAG: S8/S53 family peptidase [Candidatus Kapaibacterium sp.]